MIKTYDELLTRVKCELDKWFKLQCMNLHTRYYLFYKPSTLEQDGDVIINTNNPDQLKNCYALAWQEHIRRDLTVDQNLRWLSEVCLSRLPVLSIRQ